MSLDPLKFAVQIEDKLAVRRLFVRLAVGGGTDTGVISRSRGGVPAGCLSIPIRYTHSPNEIANLRVAEQCARLLAAALRD